jgi:2-isopropylmalate synthase
MTHAEVIERTKSIVAYASGRFDEVEFCCEDALRTDPAFVVQVCRAAVEAGAAVLKVAANKAVVGPNRRR